LWIRSSWNVGRNGSQLNVKIMIATVAEIRIEEEREHVVNPQKHSNHVDHFAFTTTGASITPKDMRHSCGMCMTRMKQCKDRDREQRELNDYIESMPSRPADYMSHEDTSSDSGNGFENLCRD
jgi:hypothetical protein